MSSAVYELAEGQRSRDISYNLKKMVHHRGKTSTYTTNERI